MSAVESGGPEGLQRTPVMETYVVHEDDKDVHVINLVLTALRRHMPGQPLNANNPSQLSHTRALAVLDYVRHRVAVADAEGRAL